MYSRKVELEACDFKTPLNSPLTQHHAHQVRLVVNDLNGLASLLHLILVAGGRNIEIVEREGPKCGVELWRNVFPDLGCVQLTSSLNYRVQD